MAEKNTTKNSTEGKLCAILAYLLVGIIWYFADEKMKKNEFVKFHVKQALVLLIFSLAGSIVLGMTFILAWLIPLYQVAIFIILVVGIINANNGDKKELPIIGKFASIFKF
ncbi:MAG: DUF4870 domain-containing protein [Patescibacteria group bacterium]